MDKSWIFLSICGIAVKWSRECDRNALYVYRRRGDIIDSHSSRKRRARVCIKARRDRKAERGPIAIQFSSFFSSFHSETPLFTALRCSCAAALPPSPRRDSPPSTGETTFSARAPPLGSGSRALSTPRRELHADARAFLRIASTALRDRAPMRTNNLTPRGAPGHLPAARSRVINNVSSTLCGAVHDGIR